MRNGSSPVESTSLTHVIDGPSPVQYESFAGHVEAEAFGAQSIPKMVALTIVTLTAYMPYWLYTRTRTLERITHRGISSALVHGVLAAYALAFVGSLGQLLAPYADAQRLMLAAVALIANTGMLVWVLWFRRQLVDEVLHRHPKPEVGILMTVFFSIFYLQSKINQAQDRD